MTTWSVNDPGLPALPLALDQNYVVELFSERWPGNGGGPVAIKECRRLTVILAGYGLAPTHPRLRRDRLYAVLWLIKISLRRVRIYEQAWNARMSQMIAFAEASLRSQEITGTETVLKG